jgi:FixJ family two-component response regulator
VGEIAHYARHRENAIFVMDDSAAVGDVLALLIDDARYAVMRQGAVATWVNRPLYKDSMLAACREALGIDKETAAT